MRLNTRNFCPPSQKSIKALGIAGALTLTYTLSYLLPNILGFYAALQTIKTSCKKNNYPCELFEIRTGHPILNRLHKVVVPWIVGVSFLLSVSSYVVVKALNYLYINAKKHCCPNATDSFSITNTNRLMRGLKKIIPNRDALFYFFVTFASMTTAGVTISFYSAAVLAVEMCDRTNDRKFCRGFEKHNVTQSSTAALEELSMDSFHTMLGTGITLDLIVNACISVTILAISSYFAYQYTTGEKQRLLGANANKSVNDHEGGARYTSF